MIDPFDADDMPDEALWELSDPDYDFDDDDPTAINFHAQQLKEHEVDLKIKQPISEKDHKKIRTRQQFKSYLSKEKIPSKNKEVYWLYAESQVKYKKFTKNSGKWLLFIEPKFIDAAWEQIKDATENGRLGGASKVSTLKGFKDKHHVICVYIDNWKDEKDVMRVREALRDLGFDKPIPYKTDEDTRKGKYANNSKNIAKYYE